MIAFFRQNGYDYRTRSVVQVGDFVEQGSKKQWGDRGSKQHKGGADIQPLLLIDGWVNFGCDLNALKAKKPLVDSQARLSSTVPH